MNRYCLYGKISKSYSPLIHQLFYNELKIDASYEIYEGDDLIADLRSGKYAGANVTMPYKVSIMPFLDVIDEKAKRIGAVNTIVCKENKLIGYNTDYDGFLETLKYYHIEPKFVHILGNGGASRAVKAVLDDLHIPYRIVLRNETIDGQIDLLVNATSVVDPVCEEVFNRARVIVDLHYDSLRKINGLYMLVSQALKSDELWFNKTMNEKKLFEIVKEEINNE